MGLDDKGNDGGSAVVNVLAPGQLNELVVNLDTGFGYGALTVGFEHGVLQDVFMQFVCGILGGLH